MKHSSSAITSASAWTQYWSGGRLSSCPGADDSNYAGAIAATWSTFFATLPGNCSLLDIACGNGALLAMAQEYVAAHGQTWQLTGVDRANLTQRPELDNAAIQLCSSIDMHELPYPDNSYDAVCSQYGIEYGTFPDNLNEALRVLKPGGSFQFLLHCKDSVIARRASLQLQQIDLLLDDWALFDLLAGMLERSGQDNGFAAAKQHFDETAAQAFAYMKTAPQNQDISLLQQSLQQLGAIWQVRAQRTPTASIKACRDASEALLSLRQRLRDQQAAMLDQQQAESWLGQARQCADDVQLNRLDDAARALGWCLQGSK